MENLQPKRNKLQSIPSNRTKTVSSIVNIHFVTINGGYILQIFTMTSSQ